jgi:hypothetical protein
MLPVAAALPAAFVREGRLLYAAWGETIALTAIEHGRMSYRINAVGM